MPPRLTQCKRGHDMTGSDSRYHAGGTTRCSQCVRDRVRDRNRVKSGVPLDAPVRPYASQTRRPKQTLELIHLVSSNPELAKSLLAVAKSWAVN